MSDRRWIQINPAPEGAPATKEIVRSGLEELRDEPLAAAARTSTQIVYRPSGAWVEEMHVGDVPFDRLELPIAGTTTAVGSPQVPQEGLLVAIPNGAIDLQVRVLDKETETLDVSLSLPPAPKPITEAEYVAGREEYLADPRVYDSDDEFPGKDVELIGVKSVDGVPVAHLLVYPIQYRPRSRSVSVVRSMTLELSYGVPPTDRPVPARRSRHSAVADMVLDLEHVGDAPARDRGLREDDEAGVARKVVRAGGLVPQAGTIVVEEIGEVLRAPQPLNRPEIISEYVIVTPAALAPSVAPLRKYHAGWPHYAMVATTERIGVDFPAATLEASIKAFLAWAWDNWRVPPRYVVLAGDVDTIPMPLWNVGGTSYPSDHYYADVRDNLSPEIMISRLPTSDPTRLLQVCQHLVGYAAERGPDWGGWENQVVLVAYEAPTYQQCSDSIASAISSRFKVTKLYGGASTKQQVLDRLNAGVLVANYRGHGLKEEWSSANGPNTADFRALTNDATPPMVFCVCCENAWIDDQAVETVVETFVRNGKCVAVLGATRDSPTYANNDFDKYLWQAIIDLGEVTPGGIVQRAKALLVLNYPNDVSHRQDVVMYTLFGDPAARVTSDVEFLRGRWSMDHDGWKGELLVDRIWQARVEQVAGIGYPVWSFSGTYTGQDGQKRAVLGKVGGPDAANGDPACQRSDHRVEFTVAFPGNTQKFAGYVATWTRTSIAGYTTWSNIPFGWYAEKV